MKKYRVILVIVFAFLLTPGFVSAESIADYRAKIRALEGEKAETAEKGAAVQKKIDDANAKINEISRQIAEARKEEEKTRQEIENLNKEIEQKEEEIKDLVAFYQVSDNDNFYLKFIFGADSFEDLIYRFSVAEQLTDANDKLVDEMNDLIKQNKQKVKELKKQEKRLSVLDEQIQKEIFKLGDKKKTIMEDALDAEEEIKVLEKQIAFFKKEGCSENQDVSSCGAGAPSSTGFVLPTPTGFIANDGMSEYGYRWHPIWNDYRFHSGMDISAGSGTPVYAVTNGRVIYSDWVGGYGQAVMVLHNVGGAQYTSLYAHLSSIAVSKGAVVSRGQTIGAVGSTGDSTGPHLHFQIMKGSGLSYDTVNPRNFVNFPSTGTYW